jgi:hypothetical protein
MKRILLCCAGWCRRSVQNSFLLASSKVETMQQRWPDRLWVVRHGESAGNVAREAAHAAGLARLDIAQRDVDGGLQTNR